MDSRVCQSVYLAFRHTQKGSVPETPSQKILAAFPQFTHCSGCCWASWFTGRLGRSLLGCCCCWCGCSADGEVVFITGAPGPIKTQDRKVRGRLLCCLVTSAASCVANSLMRRSPRMCVRWTWLHSEVKWPSESTTSGFVPAWAAARCRDAADLVLKISFMLLVHLPPRL